MPATTSPRGAVGIDEDLGRHAVDHVGQGGEVIEVHVGRRDVDGVEQLGLGLGGGGCGYTFRPALLGVCARARSRAAGAAGE